MLRRATWTLAAAVTLTVCRPARAAEVVLVHLADPAAAGWRVAESRMRDELRALGMTVTDARPRDTRDATMSALLTEHAAAVAVQISRTVDRVAVTLWLADPHTGAPRRLSLAFEVDQQPGLAALRAAELVRTETRALAELAHTPTSAEVATSLVPQPASSPPSSLATAWQPASSQFSSAQLPAPSSEPLPAASSLPSSLPGASVGLLPPRPPGTSPAAPPPSAASAATPSLGPATDRPPLLAPPRPPPPSPPRPPSEFADDLPPVPSAADPSITRRHGLLLAATVGGGPGGAGVLPGLELAGRRELTRRLEFGGGLTSLVAPRWHTDDRGSFLLGLVAARAQLGLRWQLGPRTSLRLALGGGLALGWAVGRATSPYRSATDLVPIGLLSSSLAVVVRLAARASLHTGFAVDVLLPALSVRSGGTEAVRLGQPLLRGLLGIAWDWPLRRP